MICEWFDIKTSQTVFAGFASKSVATVFSSLFSKLMAIISPILTSKPAIDFLVKPQNQGGGGFFGLCLKIGSSGLFI
jgi:hypothetical protein